MNRIQPVDISAIIAKSSVTDYPLNNLTRILAHSRLAMDVYMQWQPLYRDVSSIVGLRVAYLYAYVISQTAGSAFYTNLFRGIIIDNHEDPDNLDLSEIEQDLLCFGAEIAESNGRIEEITYDRLRGQYTDKEMVTLVAFAGQMIAANIFNNVLGIESADC